MQLLTLIVSLFLMSAKSFTNVGKKVFSLLHLRSVLSRRQSTTNDLLTNIKVVGDLIRELKKEKSEKHLIDTHVSKLLTLKEQYQMAVRSDLIDLEITSTSIVSEEEEEYEEHTAASQPSPQYAPRPSVARPSLDDVERISYGQAAKKRGTGSRGVPHRLNAAERKEWDLAKKRKYLMLRGTGWRKERGDR